MKDNNTYLFRRLIWIIIPIIQTITVPSCKVDHNNGTKSSDDRLFTIHLDDAIKKKIPEKKLSSIGKTVHYIPIEDNDQCILQHPAILSINDDAIIIEDNRKYIYRFDTLGKMIWKLDAVGRGPGEYVQIRDIEVDYDNDTLYILDNYQRKIIRYDLRHANYLNETRIPLSTEAFTLFNNGFVLWNPPWSFIDQDYCYFLTFIDRAGTTIAHINRIGNNNNFRGGLLTSTNFYSLEDALLIKDTYHDTIYQILPNDHLKPHAVISCGKYTISREISEDPFLREKYQDEYISQVVFLESKDYFFISFFFGKFYLVIYDKNLGTFVCRTTGAPDEYAHLGNDLDNGPAFAPFFISGNKLYSLVSPLEFLNCHSSNARITEISSQINKNSNPIIMILELKSRV